MLLAIFGSLKADEISWQGFDSIDRLDKSTGDRNSLLSINEDEAIKLIDQNAPDTEDGEKDTSKPNDPAENPSQNHKPAADGDVKDHILKETAPAEDEYFAETLFVGDSRMVGLGMTCQNIGATFYAAVGLSINQVNTKKVIKIDAETSYTVMEAIENDPRDFKRIYLMFGLNELGWAYPSVFIRSVRTSIEQLWELCPDSEICIMAIMPVSSDKSVSIYTGAEANERIREYNSLLLQLASDLDCWYLDSYNLLADEEGNLPKEFAADGIHMYSEQNKKLMNYIACHAFAS